MSSGWDIAGHTLKSIMTMALIWRSFFLRFAFSLDTSLGLNWLWKLLIDVKCHLHLRSYGILTKFLPSKFAMVVMTITTIFCWHTFHLFGWSTPGDRISYDFGGITMYGNLQPKLMWESYLYDREDFVPLQKCQSWIVKTSQQILNDFINGVLESCSKKWSF